MSETDTYPSDEEVGDVVLGGGAQASPRDSRPDARAKEAAIMNDEPLYRFRLRTGKEIRIYSKSQGQLALIEVARRQYLDAWGDYAGRAASSWRRWRKRRKAMEEAVLRVHNAGLGFLRRILEEPWDEEKSQELTDEDFQSIDHQQFASILKAHREANDIEDILMAMDPDYEEKKNSSPDDIPPGAIARGVTTATRVTGWTSDQLKWGTSLARLKLMCFAHSLQERERESRNLSRLFN